MPIASHSRLLSSPPPINPRTHNRIQIPNRVGLALRPATSTITPAASRIRSALLRPTTSFSPTMSSPPAEAAMEGFAAVANKAADAAGDVIRKYFRQKFDILDKDDLSPVTIADRDAEESMVCIILENFPSHAIFGEECGWRCKEESADYVWVLDPIDGTKSFITGKPLFGTLIALLHKGKPIVGVIDQPILKERWIGMNGRRTTLNGREISTRPCSKLSQAYLYTTSPHLFNGEADEAFIRVRNEVRVYKSSQ